MIKISKDILDSQTFKELEIICKDFDNKNYKNIDIETGNNYLRIGVDDKILKTYLIKAKCYLEDNLSIDKLLLIDFENTSSWINKVSSETNKNDSFHFDNSFITLITYLNQNFQGGQLIYIDDSKKEQSVFPQNNMTIIMENKLSHKVNPVSEGIRYSLITFFQKKQKRSKTLL